MVQKNGEKQKKKNVLLLFCGGTISMHKDERGVADVSDFGAEQLFQLEPRITELANVTVRYIVNIDSTDMAKGVWEQMVDVIGKEYKNYDGFLITQGTNTMAYASSALTWALLGIGKPVVLTGSQIPAETISSDARNNVVNGLRLATMNLGGVFVVFGSKIILGCRAKKQSESEIDAFKTFNDSDFGEISIAMVIKKQSNPGHNRPFKIHNGFEDNIACLTLIPGLRPEAITTLIDNGAKGIVLRAYGSGDISQNLLSALYYAQEKKVPVVVTTQCPGGATVIGVNKIGFMTLQTGIIQAFDMSMETMSTKLMWLLGQGVSYEELKKKMHEDMAGEVNVSRAKIFLNIENA